MKMDRKGMYCSRQFADWMIEKNKRDTDFPAISYYKLIRLFSRTNYKELFEEEERKGNQFFYNIEDEGDRISLHSSYELVFLPYDGSASESNDCDEAVGEPEPVDKLIPGYRILQTRGCLPGSTGETFGYGDHYSMKYIVDEMVGRAKACTEFAEKKGIDIEGIIEEGRDKGLGFNPYAKSVRFDDIFRASEFQRAEERGFIDNEWPYSWGPQCPDKIICRQTYTRIINQLMREVDRLGLAGNRDEARYELKVASYVAAILQQAGKNGFRLSEGINKELLKKGSTALFDKFVSSEDDPDEICRKIRTGLLWDVNIVIDLKCREYSDYDYKDVREAPLGLTVEDYEDFEDLRGNSEDENE